MIPVPTATERSRTRSRSPAPHGGSTGPSSDRLSLSLTVRHLPTDEWTTVRIPVEWRAYDLKRFALSEFDAAASESRSHSRVEARAAATATPTRAPIDAAAEAQVTVKGSDKENERRGETQLSGDYSLLSVRGAAGLDNARESKSPGGGVRRFANALRDRLSSKDLTTLPSRTSPSPLRHVSTLSKPSLSPLPPPPSRHSLSASSTPTSSKFNFDYPTRPRVRNSEDTHSRRSSLANFESLQLLSGGGGGSGGGQTRRDPFAPDRAGLDETETLVAAAAGDDASSRTARRIERSKSLSDKGKGGKDGGSSPVQSRKSFAAWSNKEDDVDERKLSHWVLVNAITGGVVPDHAIVGSKFVDNDLLTLKPCRLLYDPPLHLYHLPYLHCPSASVLSATLSNCHTVFEFSASKGHSRRRSFGGGKYGKEDFVERRIEICVDDGVYAATQGDYDMTPGTTMVLKVIKAARLEAIYALPPTSVQLVSSSTSSHSTAFPPPLPTSSSTASLANFVLPSGPPNLRQSTSPLPSSRKRVKSIPLIQLSWDEGETLALRAKDKDEHDRLMKLLGEPRAEDERSDEAELRTRKDLVDLAYASRHQLFDPFPSRPASRAQLGDPLRPRPNRFTTGQIVTRPTMQPRSVSDSSAFLPRVPSRSSSLDARTTPSRSSSVLHVRQRDSSLDMDFPRLSNRTPSTCTSNSTVSDSPSTPTSVRTPNIPEHSFDTTTTTTMATTPTATKTKTIVTPATPHAPPAAVGSSYSPTTNPSPASLMSSSSSYFSLHSPPLTLLPFSYTHHPPPPLPPVAAAPPPASSPSSSMSFTRAKSSLDLTSTWAIRSSSSRGSRVSSASASALTTSREREWERGTTTT